MAFVASSPALLRAARAPATSTRRPVAAARVVMAADPQKAPSSEGPVTSGGASGPQVPRAWRTIWPQLADQAADHVEDPAGLTNKVPKEKRTSKGQWPRWHRGTCIGGAS
eukprot:TRINITY_DN436_c0_g1_i5.p5 TRINITY_DN436_c0_g1~~TRINITY_DN436_c0_g1_i5.p5  ORF type:complete len:110 (-),score=2.20 TRINITY_DN436_c0_g1_i5:162-491(-)